MPEDSKKNADKKKHDPKEQRKPRHSRHQSGKSDRKIEKVEEIKASPKVTVSQKPVYEDPGPEFYKNLKRETEEIVKITEAENAKYKKKEIQSNWAKYEMPIESYEDLDEQDVGADYEELIQAPLSAGAHFQFKHEKSWDTSTAPSLYDKYFELKMDDLSTAISTIPFYERNDIDQSEFSESDLLSMNSRASKYKLKYYNNKAYSTPETESQDKILNSLKENLIFNEKKSNLTENEKFVEVITDIVDKPDKYEVNLDFNIAEKPISSVPSVISDKIEETTPNINDTVDDFDDEFIFKDVPSDKSKTPEVMEKVVLANKDEVLPIPKHVDLPESNKTHKDFVKSTAPANVALPEEHPVTANANPVIQTPEDLEKWLDDFLDS